MLAFPGAALHLFAADRSEPEGPVGARHCRTVRARPGPVRLCGVCVLFVGLFYLAFFVCLEMLTLVHTPGTTGLRRSGRKSMQCEFPARCFVPCSNKLY